MRYSRRASTIEVFLSSFHATATTLLTRRMVDIKISAMDGASEEPICGV